MDRVRLGDLAFIKTGKLDANAQVENGKFPFFTCAKEVSRIDSYSYDCECVLVAGNGDLNVKYYNGKFDAYQRTYIIETIDTSIINVKYLYHFMSSYIAQLRMQSIGGIIKFIKLGNLTEAQIPLPDLLTQQKIANTLDKAAELIEKRKTQITALDDLTQSIFHDIFGECDYKKMTLKDSTTFIDYRGKTPELDDAGEIRMINAKSVGKGVFKYINEFITETTYQDWMTRGFPNVGDVLFVTEGHTFGNVCRIPEHITKFAMGQRVITIQGKTNVLDNTFLEKYMQTQSFKKDIDKYKTGSSAQGIRSKELIKVQIPLPPIELQNKFAETIQTIEQQKELLQQGLAELETNFNALMQKAFKDELF